MFVLHQRLERFSKRSLGGDGGEMLTVPSCTVGSLAEVRAHDLDGTGQLTEVRELDELLVAVHRTAHPAALLVDLRGELEVLEAQRRAEGADEEDRVALHVLDGPVVAGDVRPLETTILDGEGDAVHQLELRAHGRELGDGGGAAGDRVGGEQAECLDLLEEERFVDATFLAEGTRSQPPARGAVRAHVHGLAPDLLHGLEGVGGSVERRGELLHFFGDHPESARDARIEPGGVGRAVQRQASHEGTLAVVEAGPGAEGGEAIDVGGDERKGGGEGHCALHSGTGLAGIAIAGPSTIAQK